MEEDGTRNPLLIAKQESEYTIISNDNGNTDESDEDVPALVLLSSFVTASARFGSNYGRDEAGIPAVLLLSSFVTASALFSAGCVGGYSAPAESGIRDDLGLSLSEYSVFGSIMAIGGIIGALVSGKIADFLGRKWTMWIMDIFYLVGWVAIYFAESAWILDVGRLLLGFGFGLTCFVGPIYVAETTPEKLKGASMTISQSMSPFGVSVMYLIGSFLQWRALALVGAIPCILQFICVFFVPESPRWLAKVGREREFEDALQRLRGKNADISKEAAEIKDHVKSLQYNSEESVLSLFQRKYAHILIVGVGLLALQQFGGLYGFSFYMTEIFELAGISTTLGYIVVAVVEILAIVLGSYVIDKFGRRTLLMASAIGECLGCLITGLSLLFESTDSGWWKDLRPILVLLGILVFMTFYLLGMGAIPWLILAETFPISLSVSAGSVGNLVNRLSSWVVSYTFNFLIEWSSAGTFFVYASISGLTVLFIALLVPETKGRKREEILASLNHTSK